MQQTLPEDECQSLPPTLSATTHIYKMSAHEKMGTERPENGCFGLEKNEMIPQRLILHRKCLIKWFYAVAPLKEGNVHCTETTILIFNFLSI